MGVKLRGVNLGYMIMDMELMVAPHPNYILHSQRKEASKQLYQCPSLAYIIEHPDGRVLVDTGLSTNFAAEWQADWQFLIDLSEITPEKLLESRLKALGYGPEDFNYVIQTHLHTDHAGGLRLFEHADVDVLIHEDEYRWVTRNIDSTGDFFVREDWNHLGTKRPTLVCGDEEVMKGVRMLSLPGHTPGTMGVLLHLNTTGWVLMTGDSLYTHESYGPPATGTPIVHDREQWATSVEKIRRMATARDAFVLPGHDETGIQHKDGQTEFKEIQLAPFQPGYVYE
ncbi:MAG: MBL fold metallo-hydrolase [Streptosporangiales bacterium]|nr:MBL fold metallo-hydrolase [Streptosporangiales bacterium]